MNIANKLTIFRVFLIPVVMILAEIRALQNISLGFMTLGNFIILVIFLIGMFTDFLDGYLARKHNLVTDFGKFADPLADKILVLALLVILLEQDSLLPGWVVTLILAREFIVTGFRILAANANVVIAAGTLGKIKTNFQFLMVVLLLILGTNPSMNWFAYLVLIIVYLTAILTVVSGAEYLWKNRQVFGGKTK